MASIHLGSFLVSFSVDGNCRRSTKCAKRHHASFYITKASWWYKTKKNENEYHMVRHQQLNLRNQYRGSEGVSICEECDRRYVVSATHAKSFESESEDHSPRNFWGSVKYSLDALYMFSRPYTMIASVMNIISMSLLAVDKLSDISPTFFIGLLKAMAVILPMTLYVNGVNQLVDIEIDKINKSYLPLASRQYSFAMGCFIVALSLILSYGLGWTVGSPPLLWIISSHFILGTAYSINLPLLRWKRSSVLTAMYIIFDKGMLFQLALFLHMQTFVFKRPIMFPRSLIFAIVFMSFFSVVIALSKDIPDIEGDKKFGVRTLSVRLGQKQVFWICVSLLEMAYGIAILIGATSSCLWSKLITGLGHTLLAAILWYHAKSVDIKNKVATQSFYMFIWKLLYMEYFIIPLVR